MSNPKLFVISAPSGCGKTTIVHKILHLHPEIHFSVSATTRQRRNSEIHGKDYFFLTKEEFESYIKNDNLIEWQNIYGEYYGTLKDEVIKYLNIGKSVIFDIDVLGALNIKKHFPNNSILIFIDVIDKDVLIKRLRNRNTESEETLKKRIDRIEEEFQLKPLFDYTIINDKLEIAIEEVNDIINKQLEEV